MKFISFVLISALVFAAASNEVQDTSDFITGFSGSLNVTDPHVSSCPEGVMNASVAFTDAMTLIQELEDGDAIEQAVGNFGFKAAHGVRVCANVYSGVSTLVGTVGNDIASLDIRDVSSRIFANLATFQMKFMAAKTAIANGDYKTLGGVVGDVYKVIFYGSDASRTIRELSMFSRAATSAPVNFNATYLGFLGFLEEANTTVAVNDYVAFSNDTSAMVGLVSTLADAIEKMDFATIMSTFMTMKDKFTVLTNDIKTLDAEITQFIQRDLPLFDSAAQIQKISQYMFANLPTTMMNFQRIMNAYKVADFRELGHGTGALYNQVRTGAMSSF